VITRLRLDAALDDPAPPREPGPVGRPRVRGERQLTVAERLLEPQAVRSTDLTVSPARIIAGFVARSPLAVTFHKARAQLGVETQRQGSGLVADRPQAVAAGA
jgi:hypothetical protein